MSIQVDAYLGEIRLFAFEFIPRGWVQCNGQLLDISQNQALYSLLGTMYGGDGQTNFALPDLRGRAPIHMGQGAKLTNRPEGSKGGHEENILTGNQFAQHRHTVYATSEAANTVVPHDNFLASSANNALPTHIWAAEGTKGLMAANVVGGQVGDSQHPHYNLMQPSLAVSFCIALEGIMPPRN